ncbi:hypothetical protein BJF92_14040 [Rhizobium rhizosphaerae]|uniref:Phage tail tape measure protein n=1 Tax=Xaviernesmea rhizosphaerae TaxID=1672749 RepID=A0A1Q9AI83_9HYPH|nr:hypothetical protein [Xaviernesmea rhizosphaerae]OLP54916.1 hypothetical protein BJF92_14040 [Xaviernesmea rhizosphaerae]
MRRARSFGTALTGALTAGLRDGRSLEDVLRQTALRLSDIALQAGLQPLQNLVGATASSLIEGLGKAAGATPGLTPGSSPNLAIAAGERGAAAAPASSPLAAAAASAFTADGQFATPALLRQAASARDPGLSEPVSAGMPASAAAPAAPSVVFNIRTEDAASFRRSEGQIAAMLSRTVLRGRRGL